MEALEKFIERWQYNGRDRNNDDFFDGLNLHLQEAKEESLSLFRDLADENRQREALKAQVREMDGIMYRLMTSMIHTALRLDDLEEDGKGRRYVHLAEQYSRSLREAVVQAKREIDRLKEVQA